MSKHRIPTSDNPIDSKYIKPVAQFLIPWYHDPLFYQDFIYCCPFNKFLVEHFQLHLNIATIDDTWKNLFRYFSRTYSGAELANLAYEAFHDLGKGGIYLMFLRDNNYMYMWPNGEHFCDPALECPEPQ